MSRSETDCVLRTGRFLRILQRRLWSHPPIDVYDPNLPAATGRNGESRFVSLPSRASRWCCSNTRPSQAAGEVDTGLGLHDVTPDAPPIHIHKKS